MKTSKLARGKVHVRHFSGLPQQRGQQATNPVTFHKRLVLQLEKLNPDDKAASPVFIYRVIREVRLNTQVE